MVTRLTLLIAVSCLFLLIYFHLYFNTDFRHILISTTSLQTKRKQLCKEPHLTWDEALKGPMSQNHSDLLTYINSKVIHLPTHSSIAYNLTTNTDPSMGQTMLIQRALSNMRNGFFVECGAWDGETRSNTLILEKDYGWRGLLVEADAENFRQLQQKRRKAWSANVCLAVKPYPHKATFEHSAGRGKILTSGSTGSNVSEVQCFPLFSLLSALNVTQVDYLSLDVEGYELDVLKTIPQQFLRRHIKTMSVEYVHDPGGRLTVQKWMSANGFSVFGRVTDQNNLANDMIFVNRRNVDSILSNRLHQNQDSILR